MKSKPIVWLSISWFNITSKRSSIGRIDMRFCFIAKNTSSSVSSLNARTKVWCRCESILFSGHLKTLKSPSKAVTMNFSRSIVERLASICVRSALEIAIKLNEFVVSWMTLRASDKESSAMSSWLTILLRLKVLLPTLRDTHWLNVIDDSILGKS